MLSHLHSQVTHSDVCSIKLHHPHTHREDSALVCVFSLTLISDSLLLHCCTPMPASDNINDSLLDLLADIPRSSLCSLTCSEVTLVESYRAIVSTGQMEKGSTRLQLQAKPLYEHVPGVCVNNASAQVAKFMSTLLI